ncbi:peptidoglycan-binding domain-containing protein [Pseudoponticoccus marisrubri]|uniref:Peptidoglycan binding-like domain-containing protein n=1 Tax=Pseudoponticoccus marisrubri TaxID=1685382 RepID=A0A0W7WNV8_9RHOB|nr:peptidoglycan-binding domain-containing protein [Pseudoponticoccus marisrubri]KUF12246.1 hypothetical protein AVJ23_00475 [Pseudoponticoccus marisrubri]
MSRFPALLCAAAIVGACGARAPMPDAPASRAAFQPGPPPLSEPTADGTCRAREATPAVYEHVMGEVQVVQAEIAEDGTVLRAPVYRRAPVPRIVRPRGEFTFEAPCPEVMTQEFIASVQRALAARGYFAGNVNGQLDAPTATAIGKYQTERGLESDQLSLETARALGLIAVELPQG